MPVTELRKPQFIKSYRNNNIIALTEAVAQGEFSKSVRVNIEGFVGYIAKIKLVYWKRGTGNVRTPQLSIHIFSEDPLISYGDTDLDDFQMRDSLGEIQIASSEWISITSTANVTKNVLFPFEVTSKYIWIAIKNLGADTIVGDVANGEAITLQDLTIEFLPISQKRIVDIYPYEDWVSKINRLQPGQIGQLQVGNYISPSGPITVNGSKESQILIRGSGYLQSVFDGQGTNNIILQFDNCSYINLENVIVTNHSGIDGSVDYSATVRANLYEGIRFYQCTQIGIYHCYFKDISTRGILLNSSDDGNDDITIENNIFFGVGDDTASGDVSASDDTNNRNITIRYNLFSGNVDGYVGGGTNVLIEHNIFIFQKWENCIDLKEHTSGQITTVRYNVLYGKNSQGGTLNIQNGSADIAVHGNIIQDAAGSGGIRLAAQNAALNAIEIVGNWFRNIDASQTHILFTVPGDVLTLDDIQVLHNIFDSTALHAITNNDPSLTTNIKVQNNIFNGGTNAVNPAAGSGFSGATNMYYNDVAIWGDDSNPIEAIPIYETSPIGPLADESPGKGEATILSGHDYGNDVGIPSTFESLIDIELKIYNRLRNFFSLEEITQCYERGGIDLPV